MILWDRDRNDFGNQEELLLPRLNGDELFPISNDVRRRWKRAEVGVVGEA